VIANFNVAAGAQIICHKPIDDPLPELVFGSCELRLRISEKCYQSITCIHFRRSPFSDSVSGPWSCVVRAHRVVTRQPHSLLEFSDLHISESRHQDNRISGRSIISLALAYQLARRKGQTNPGSAWHGIMLHTISSFINIALPATHSRAVHP
jgi:hypothetical protein